VKLQDKKHNTVYNKSNENYTISLLLLQTTVLYI